MLKTGILNPHINELLSRFRHTNTIVIADRGFPSWPTVPTVDIALVDGIPTVLDVLKAIREAAVIGNAWMAQEFADTNDQQTVDTFQAQFAGVEFAYEQHDLFKTRVPKAIGLIRTADTVPYANMILESA